MDRSQLLKINPILSLVDALQKRCILTHPDLGVRLGPLPYQQERESVTQSKTNFKKLVPKMELPKNSVLTVAEVEAKFAGKGYGKKTFPDI